jgi:phosphoribosylanthranilate isomerase
MAIEIKICGLREPRTLDAALDEGVDHIGLVFFSRSPRNVDLDRAAELAEAARGRARIVALVVNPDEPSLDMVMSRVRPDVVQFHGQERPHVLEAFRARHRAEIWKAFPVATADDLGALAAFRGLADRVLFDARPPSGADRPGGHGQAFDWSLLRNLDPDTGFMLSGGLNPRNVADAIRQTGAAAVDVSSGVEDAPGEKSADLIRAFVRAVRSADERQRTQTA